MFFTRSSFASSRSSCVVNRSSSVGKVKSVQGISASIQLTEDVNAQDEQLVTGRLSNNSVVHIRGGKELIGQIVEVTLDECRGFYYMGTLV